MAKLAITGCTLVGFYLMARAIVHSKYGRVLQAIRDAETRVMFTGYDPLRYKLAIWVISAVMCGIALPTGYAAALARSKVHPAIWQYPVWSWWNPLLLFVRIIFNRGCCVQPAEDYHPIKTLALGRYRSQIEPALPWIEPVLQPELVRVCNSGQESFFRLTIWITLSVQTISSSPKGLGP